MNRFDLTAVSEQRRERLEAVGAGAAASGGQRRNLRVEALDFRGFSAEIRR